MIESVDVVIKQPGHADRVVRLQEGATRLGRAEDNEVVLSDVGVSRRHAQIYVSRGEVTVEDLGSGNGTYYNGYRVQSQPVQDGDEIVVDPFILQFRIRGMERGGAGDAAARGNGGAPARLDVVVGTGMAGSSYPITSRGLGIGRSEDRDVVIPDPAASRHHCQISVQGGEYVLRDMGSANGVFVNAVRVRECTLADGDMIRIGNTEMRFVRYDEQASDNTTQVVQGEQQWNQQPRGPSGWNEPVPPSSPPATHSMPPAPAPRRSGSRPLIAVLFGGLLAFVLMLAVLVLVLVIVFVALSIQPKGPPVFDPRPPQWYLELPPNLPAAPVDTLFEQGREKMRARDHRAALQDFYRVLQTDPGYLYVDKFAYAAGETLVMEALSKEFASRSKARAEREAERDQLLAQSRRSGRVGNEARLKLKQKFKADPLVRQELDLPAPDDIVAVEKRAAEGTTLFAENKYDEAAKAFEEVLRQSEEPATRKQALANLRLAQKEIARVTAPTWSLAVMLEAEGKRAEAKQLFQELATGHPTIFSAQAHLARL